MGRSSGVVRGCCGGEVVAARREPRQGVGMTDAPEKKDDQMLHDLLGRLVASRVLSPFQADWLVATGVDLGSDAFAHPHLRMVPEHTRAMLERAAL